MRREAPAPVAGIGPRLGAAPAYQGAPVGSALTGREGARWPVTCLGTSRKRNALCLKPPEPLDRTLAGDDAPPFLEMLAELALPHAVRADVQQRRSRPIAGTQPVNPEACEHNSLPCHEDRHELCRRDIGIELEIKARPAVIPAGDVGPFPD